MPGVRSAKEANVLSCSRLSERGGAEGGSIKCVGEHEADVIFGRGGGQVVEICGARQARRNSAQVVLVSCAATIASPRAYSGMP